jgi:hypothetical protein
MEYFNSNLENHYMQFLPRYLSDEVNINVHDELTNIDENIEDLVTIISGEFMAVNFNYNFRSGASYTIEVSSSDGLIFRTKAKAL